MTRDAELKFSNLSAEEGRHLMGVYAQLMSMRTNEVAYENAEPEYLDRNGMSRSDPFQAARETAAYGDTPEAEDEPDTAGAADVDSAGLPWREDTHSGSRKQTSTGAWALRRGCPETLAADYRRRFAAASTATKAAPGWTPPATQAAAPTPEQLNQQFAPHLAPAAPPPPPHLTVPSVDYQTWYNLYVALAGAGRFEGQDAWLTTMNQQCGVSGMGEYQTNDRARALSYSALMHFQG